MWCLCEAGHFSYSESLRTPPLEGTSLHRRNNSVERPRGILSLFTTCFWLRVNSPFQPEAGDDTNIIICICRLYEMGRFSYGESPRPPRESEPVYDLFTITSDFSLPEAVPDTYIILHIGSLWSKPHGAVPFSYHGSARGGRDGGTQLFQITNGCHTSTWHTSELNNDHVLGNNTWTCGLRSTLKHNAWGYISCHFMMTTRLHQPQKSKVNRS